MDLVIQHSNTEAISQAIQDLVDSPEELSEFQGNALASRDQLSWEEQEHKLLDAYKAIFSDTYQSQS